MWKHWDNLSSYKNACLLLPLAVVVLQVEVPLRKVITALSITATTLYLFQRTQKSRSRYRRRTSHGSAFGANRQLLEESLSWKQNVINTLLVFEDALSRDDFLKIMTTLTNKYERLGAVPCFDGNDKDEFIWHRIHDIDMAVNKAVTVDSEYADREKDGDRDHSLRRVHAHVGSILEFCDDNGEAMPLWRVVRLSPKVALFRIDHCVCDGLSGPATAVSLLKEVGIKTTTGHPLKLSDLSPLLRAVERAGNLRISLSPFKLFWPPNLVEPRFLALSLSADEEAPNPLRPAPEHLSAPIPAEHYGTVHFPTMPVELFKDIARAMGNGTTINDVLMLCLSMAFGQYMDALSQQGRKDCNSLDRVKVLLPIANPLRPSMYGDYHGGLCNRMTPVIVPLDIPRRDGGGEEPSFSPEAAIKTIHAYMTTVKWSNTPLLMTCLNTILAPLLSLDQMKKAARESFKAISCIYSNVPGPLDSISLTTSSPVAESAKDIITSYKIVKIQVIMPHPASIFQALSYDSSLFCNVTLDTRSGTDAWILRESFVEAVRGAADAAGVGSQWEDELAGYRISKEWGGNGVVYSCGRPDADSFGDGHNQKVPRAA